MFRRIAITATVLSAAALLATSPRPAAAAGSAQSTLTVQATVLGGCTIDPGSVNFSNYAPGAATDTDLPASVIVVRCTNGTAFKLDLDAGSNAEGTTRRMKGGVGDAEYLRYELYEDAGRTRAWRIGSEEHTVDETGAGLHGHNVSVWGRIERGQFVSPGAYSDTVTMTVNF